MNKIDISEWGTFHLYDIFEIDSGTKLDKIKMKTDNPKINFVGRSGINNGITSKVDEIEGLIPYKKGNLTLALGGAYLGSCFVQTEDFYTSQNVVVLIPKNDLSFYSKQFIANIIFKESQLHYKAFLDELNPHIKTDFSFKLPVTSDGNINYKLMDNYILEKTGFYNKKMEQLLRISKVKRNNINTNDWEEFKISEFFDIHPTSHYNLTNNKLFEENGDIPVIVNSSYNNGIGGYINKPSTENGGIITFSDTTSCDAIFYQEADFIGYSHVQGVYPKEPKKWNKYSMLFFLTVFKKAAYLAQFDYVNKFTRDNALELVVKLPVDADGNVDYNYMEDYMKRKFDFNIKNFNLFFK